MVAERPAEKRVAGRIKREHLAEAVGMERVLKEEALLTVAGKLREKKQIVGRIKGAHLAEAVIKQERARARRVLKEKTQPREAEKRHMKNLLLAALQKEPTGEAIVGHPWKNKTEITALHNRMMRKPEGLHAERTKAQESSIHQTEATDLINPHQTEDEKGRMGNVINETQKKKEGMAAIQPTLVFRITKSGMPIAAGKGEKEVDRKEDLTKAALPKQEEGLQKKEKRIWAKKEAERKKAGIANPKQTISAGRLEKQPKKQTKVRRIREMESD